MQKNIAAFLPLFFFFFFFWSFYHRASGIFLPNLQIATSNCIHGCVSKVYTCLNGHRFVCKKSACHIFTGIFPDQIDVCASYVHEKALLFFEARDHLGRLHADQFDHHVSGTALIAPAGW